jgi:hypothetical protein
MVCMMFTLLGMAGMFVAILVHVGGGEWPYYAWLAVSNLLLALLFKGETKE